MDLPLAGRVRNVSKRNSHTHPDVVGQVQDVASIQSDCPAAERECVGPLSAAAAARLQQPTGVVVARKSAGFA